MLFKTIQWNIGGARIRQPGSPAEGPYDGDGLKHVVDVLKRLNVDIVTLQETHANDQGAQAAVIAKDIGLPYVVNDVYDKSHIEEGWGLGQAILSRFPVSEHDFKFFFNPRYEIVRPDGATWISHDKGVSKCLVAAGNGKTIQVATLHLIPFRKFGVGALEEKQSGLRDNITDLASPTSGTFILQGDFNFDSASLKPFLPNLLNQGLSEVLLDRPTTPKGRKYDHVVFRGLALVRSEVISDALTDHFPVYSEFEV